LSKTQNIALPSACHQKKVSWQGDSDQVKGAMKMQNELKSKIKYIELKKPEVKFDLLAENPSAHFTRELMAKVVDHKDKVLCDAIIEYAAERGYTDIFLIDEEFIRSAIIHEIQRRANDENNV
jgi:hypothetical protein